uniref:Ig-like domain-containing protein n=1 Tax=Zonotrichia albicollis TaxID=44394 RepID=A0A8D2MDD3_ZONAL
MVQEGLCWELQRLQFGEVLQEAGGGQRAPGDSVTLSCRGSGFTFENHYVRWYRQAPRGRFEWVSWISHYSSQIQFGSAVEGRATASRDNSQSVASLSLHLLRAGDTACYFCAVRTETQIQLRLNTNHLSASQLSALELAGACVAQMFRVAVDTAQSFQMFDSNREILPFALHK